MPQPLVSVIVPTFNRSPYLQTALHSVFAQTLTDFELIVVDDGSTDETATLLDAIRDPRLRVVRHETNRGIATARNSGLAAASGKYIAWLDSDDTCRRGRLAAQARFLATHDDIALVGGCAGKIDGEGRRRRGVRIPPFDPTHVRCWLLFKSAFQQSSVMGRAAILKDVPYDPAFRVCEDIDVFARLAGGHRMANIPAVLVDRRMHEGQVSRERRAEVIEAQARISAPQLTSMGVTFTHDELLRHAALARAHRTPPTPEFIGWVEEWLQRLRAANLATGYVDGPALEFVSSYVRFELGRRSGPFRATSGLLSRAAAGWAARALPVAARQVLASRF